jgi:hypothetical protein
VPTGTLLFCINQPRAGSCGILSKPSLIACARAVWKAPASRKNKTAAPIADRFKKNPRTNFIELTEFIKNYPLQKIEGENPCVDEKHPKKLADLWNARRGRTVCAIYFLCF